MGIQVHYDPRLAEVHVLNVVDLRTCEADGEEWPCIARQLMDDIDYMNENGVSIGDVTRGHWLSGPHVSTD